MEGLGDSATTAGSTGAEHPIAGEAREIEVATQRCAAAPAMRFAHVRRSERRTSILPTYSVQVRLMTLDK
jgi:hypothetical protein